MSKQTEKYISKITTDLPNLNDLLIDSLYETSAMAAIYVIVKLSWLRPAIGQKVISTLEPLIEVWREEPYEWREDEEREDWQEWLIEDRKKWIYFGDRFITKKALATQKTKEINKITTGVQGLNGLLESSEDETIAAIYVIVKLSLLRPEVGQKIILALRPLIKLWREGHYGQRLPMGEPEQIQRWICFYDRFIRKRSYRRYK
ncbi:MAG: hypothetical protein MUO27_08230 [Sedimentisphaerales bacterium]|nr:hypothetical protein [Sedimentisphaerales bacterium]